MKNEDRYHLDKNGVKQYSLIFADPPWWYNNRKTGGERKKKTEFGGGAQKHYPLMKNHELLAMADFVKSISAPNSVLFLWVTYPTLGFGIQLLKEWGFRYTTAAFHWIKTSKSKSNKLIYGPGYYTASNPECVLIGVRGSMCPAVRMMPSVYLLPRGEHSKKPDLFYDLARELYPEGNRLELFAKVERPGWDVWGNETTLEIPSVREQGGY